jgi:alkanesulfonate monooxygenase SsuD/methylene tetrahydromethanopterin reductase-like flavin-dependent oxidoreductase (luciferase family)
VAGRTEHLKLRPMVIAPFADPLRLAEELAVLDLASAGRLTPIVLAGYAPHELEMFGVDRRQRGALVEEAVEVLKQAWTGEPFTFRGRTVRVTPRPHQQPRPTIVVGGMSTAGARRAARIGDEFQAGEGGHWRAYVEACAELGREPGARWIAGPAFLYVTDDPEKAWPELAPYISHHSSAYAALSQADHGADATVFPRAASVEELRAAGPYKVVTPDEAVALGEQFDPAGALILTPMIGGLPPDLSWPSLELFEAEVLPRLRVPARS